MCEQNIQFINGQYVVMLDPDGEGTSVIHGPDIHLKLAQGFTLIRDEFEPVQAYPTKNAAAQTEKARAIVKGKADRTRTIKK